MAENNQTNSKRGGARKNAGRKAGSATTKTREIADKAMEQGISPLEYMLQVMRQEPADGLEPRDAMTAQSIRFEAAKAAAPYIHPRLAAVELSGPDGGPVSMNWAIEFVAPNES